MNLFILVKVLGKYFLTFSCLMTVGYSLLSYNQPELNITNFISFDALAKMGILRFSVEVLFSFLVSNIFSLGICLLVQLQMFHKYQKHLMSLIMTSGVVLKVTPFIILLYILQQVCPYVFVVEYAGVAGGVLIAFFPTLVETANAIYKLPVRTIKYYQNVVRLTKLNILRIKIRFIFMSIMPALKISSALSVIGCAVGQFLIPKEGSIGYFMTFGVQFSNINHYFIGLLVTGAVGVFFYALIDGIDKILHAGSHYEKNL